MVRLLDFVVALFTSSIRTRLFLQLEIAALRHQLSVYHSEQRCPYVGQADRLLWPIVARLWSDRRRALFFVQPRTGLFGGEGTAELSLVAAGDDIASQATAALNNAKAHALNEWLDLEAVALAGPAKAKLNMSMAN